MIFLVRDEGIEFALMYCTVLVFSICLHEYMHARAALWQGDDTAKLLGHLTLNPMKQMGVMSIAMMLVVGLAFGRVPVNSARLRRPYGEAIVSFAGPFANLMLFLIFSAGLAFCTHYGLSAPSDICYIGGVLNSVLFMLNMVPVPPLDGHGVLSSFFPGLKHSSSEFTNGATFVILMVVFMSSTRLFAAGRYLTEQVSGFALEGIGKVF